MVRAAHRNSSSEASTLAEEAPSPSPAIRRRITWIIASLGAMAIVTTVHLRLADPHRGPRILADEIGYLANARYLAGGGRIDMSQTAFYAGGYSVLLAPLSKLYAYDPARLYTSIVVAQAVLAGATVLLIAQICRWLLGTSFGWSLVVATAAGLYPTFVADSGFTWAESALTFTLVLVITIAIAVLRGVEHGMPRARLNVLAACLGVSCGAIVTMHNRTVLAVFVVIAVVGLLLWFQSRVTAAVILGISALVVAYAGQKLNHHLRDALWNGHGAVNAETKFTSLKHWHYFADFLLRLDGQSWYQGVATGGLVVLSLFALALLALRRPSRKQSPKPTRFTGSARRGGALILIGVFFGLLVVSALFLAAGRRGDHVVYGRYIDITTPLLIALGLAWLGTAPPWRDLRNAAITVATVMIGLGLVLDTAGHKELDRPYNAVTTFAIVGWLDYHRYSPAVVRATAWTLVIALGALAVTFVVRRWPRLPWIATAVATTAVVVLFAWQLGFVKRKVIHALGAKNTAMQSLIAAIDDSHVTELQVDPSIAVVGRLHLGYWLPRVHLVGATAATERCSNGLTVSKAPPTPEVTLVQRFGDFKLYRGNSACP
jgi:hypothetical protein